MSEMKGPSVDLLALSDGLDGSRYVDCEGTDLYKTSPFLKSVQWSADGTTLFTSSSDNRICSYVLPENLLETHQEATSLKAHGAVLLPETTSAIAPCPYFALENPATQAILTASKDHPIQLHYAFPQSPTEDDDGNTVLHQPPPLAAFRLIKKETEAYLPIASIIWPAPGTHFIAGTANRIAIFDVSRSDAINPEPLFSIATIPSTRHISKGNGVGMRGTVSALASQVRESGDAGLVAAGTWSRCLGLYDLQRAGSCVATWGIAGAADEAKVGGKGVIQTIWSPCGRYLVVNERKSSGLLVYDLRGTNQLLAHLTGRNGDTNQRLSCDVFPGTNAAGGFEVWAGTKDGSVVVWEGVGNHDGPVVPSWDWKAHESAVGGAAMHMSGSVVATCSGAWEILEEGHSSDSDDSDDSYDSDSYSSSSSSSNSSTSVVNTKKSRSPFVVKDTSLKVWGIGMGSGPEMDRPVLDDDNALLP